jgi:DNA-binding MarR family transcriptional regulator
MSEAGTVRDVRLDDNRSPMAPERPPAPPGAAAELLMAGAEISQVLERMVRRRADLSLAQFNALRVLGTREPQAAQPSDLTRSLRVSSAHATTVLQQLERRGLVESSSSPTDRRRRLVRLTPAGRSALDESLAALSLLEERLVAAAGSQEAAAAVWAELRRIRVALREALVVDDWDCVGP